MNKFEALKKYFGYDSFREGQESLIDSILNGQDVLGIMPTGAGKSICYQVPALLLPGITLVISPLISLMKDQVRSLNQAGVHAAYINSSLTENQISMALANAAKGQYKIIYVAPERLETYSFLDFALNASISMITVDEAHCISQWGQDFRPSYMNIVKLVSRLSKRPIVSAFTATATTNVKEDIICVLGLAEPNVLVTGFDRKNLYFEVRTPRKKDEELVSYIKEHPGESGIIYCATRKNVESVYELLLSQGLEVTKYHAGLTNEERKVNQDAFIFDEKPIVVATNAFGMGIDKSNVRYVVHYNMPQSMENYYQEAGRAGRDGEKADCVLLYSPQDVMINQFLLDNKELRRDMEEDEIRAVKERDVQRLRDMTYYCRTKECLRSHILRYFGENVYTGCGNCSNCLTEYEEIDVTDMCISIIKAIVETRQRFGINVIVGMLRGEKKAKLLSYRLDELQNYGALRDVSESRIKQVINEMLMKGILQATEDKYALLRCSEQVDEVLKGSYRIQMKISEEQEKKKTSQKKRTSDVLTSKGMDLFERLREVRAGLAREEALPPYIIGSDKTLIDMCIKLPFTKEEMLNVSGIGENKYQKYGQQFMQAIKEFMGGEKEQLYFEPVHEEAFENDSGTSFNKPEKRNKKKESFRLTPEMAERIVYLPECTMPELAGQLNELRDEKTMKKTSGAAIERMLISRSYLEERYIDGMWRKVILEKGEGLGIFPKTRISDKGREYEVLYYSQEAQRRVVEMIKEEVLV